MKTLNNLKICRIFFLLFFPLNNFFFSVSIKINVNKTRGTKHFALCGSLIFFFDLFVDSQTIAIEAKKKIFNVNSNAKMRIQFKFLVVELDDE